MSEAFMHRRGGTLRHFWGTPVGELAVDDIIYMNVNGMPAEFIVIQQGLPSSGYDSSCDGTWLLLKQCIDKAMYFHGSAVNYAASVGNYANAGFLSSLDADVLSIVKEVNLTYYDYDRDTIHSMIPVKGFLLSADEARRLSATSKIATRNGVSASWWLRDVYQVNFKAFAVEADGDIKQSTQDAVVHLCRPALILPSDTRVDVDHSIIPG